MTRYASGVPGTGGGAFVYALDDLYKDLAGMGGGAGGSTLIHEVFAGRGGGGGGGGGGWRPVPRARKGKDGGAAISYSSKDPFNMPVNMCRVFCACKGGCGKTTLMFNVACAHASICRQ